MDSRLRLEQRQGQTLTPRLQQAVRLLQLSTLEFTQAVQQALSSNPFLETEDSEEDDVPNAAEGAVGPLVDAGVQPVDQPPTTVAEDGPSDEGGWEDWGGGSGPRASNDDSDVDATDLAAASVSLREQLQNQLNMLSLSDRDRLLAGTVIEALDDDGYMRLSFEELNPLLELDPEADDTEWQIALKLVQSLEPRGVAARDLRECLLLQLDDVPDNQLARRIVSDHLQHAAQRDCERLASMLGLDRVIVDEACAQIRRLDPRPGWRFGGPDVKFLIPDVVVRKVNGKWIVRLNQSVVPRVRVNRVYAELFHSHRDSRHGELASHLQEARWTVRNIEQRFSTILRVAQAIVNRQRHFFDFGELAMKPMGLREIADELGLHESTVSRVTNNKYMATPAGIFELKYFFSRALPTSSGGTCSTTAIRGVIKDLIAAEDPNEPLSDAEIARLLHRQGLHVARRTVTKYRQMMKVPAVEARRQKAAAEAAAAAAAAREAVAA
jgi:RNA polymerase sigma-54 factor